MVIIALTLQSLHKTKIFEGRLLLSSACLFNETCFAVENNTNILTSIYNYCYIKPSNSLFLLLCSSIDDQLDTGLIVIMIEDRIWLAT